MRLIPKKINLLILLQIPQTISLIPTLRKDIERDLPANGIVQIVIGKVMLQFFDELVPDFVVLVVVFEIVAFALGAVSADWRDVYQAGSVFDECAALYWDVELG